MLTLEAAYEVLWEAVTPGSREAEALETLRAEYRDLDIRYDLLLSDHDELAETVENQEAERHDMKPWWPADRLHREAHGEVPMTLCRHRVCRDLMDALYWPWPDDRPASWLPETA